MSLRGYLILGLAVGVLGFLGLYWNQHAVERVMRDGYTTTGKITSAEVVSSRFPFVFDEGWPHFVDENLAIGLRWTGRDGIQRERKGIAVSAAYAARILVGNQVRLLTVPIQVVDDDSSVPVLVEDVSDHLDHIRSLSGFMLALAGVFAAILALVVGWQTWSARRSGLESAATNAGPRRPFPYVLALMTGLMLLAGAFMLANSYFEQSALKEMLDHGDEVSADLTRAYGEVRKPGEAPSYLVTLAWTDKSGQRQTYGPTHISAAFWQQITRNGIQTVRQTKIRYLDGRRNVRPLIVDDAAERQFQDSVGYRGGAVLLVVGLILGGVTVFCFLARSKRI